MSSISRGLIPTTGNRIDNISSTLLLVRGRDHCFLGAYQYHMPNYYFASVVSTKELLAMYMNLSV